MVRSGTYTAVLYKSIRPPRQRSPPTSETQTQTREEAGVGNGTSNVNSLSVSVSVLFCVSAMREVWVWGLRFR